MGKFSRVMVAVAAFAASMSLGLPANAAQPAPPESSATSSAHALGPVPSGVDDFEFRNLDVDYTIGRDDDGTSTLEVVETFTAVFPESDQNRGIRRSIPDTYNDQPVNPELISITDETGAERPSETASDDGTFQMTSKSDDYLHGTQVFVFTYTLEHVTWSFDGSGTEEFYWDVNGVDWAQPFQSIDVTLHVPGDLASALAGDQSCYVGAQGSDDTCQITSSEDADGSTTLSAHAGSVEPYQTMTIAVGFAPGTFVMFDHSLLASGWGWLQLLGLIGLVLLLVPSIIIRTTTLRDSPGRPTIIAEYEPPRGLDSLQASTLLGTSKGPTAKLLELAVNGSIRIVEGPPARFGKAKFQAELVDPMKADVNGRLFLQALFQGEGPGATYTFGETDNGYARNVMNILKSTKTDLKRYGMWRNEKSFGMRLVRLLSWLLVAASIGGGVMALIGHVSPLVPIILFVVAVIVHFTCLTLISHKALTPLGAELTDHLKGLKVFIEWAEADRIRMLQSPAGAERRQIDTNDPRQVLWLYEQLLPYAVIFGQEKQWADHLAVLYEHSGYTAPAWYYGTAGFNAATFSSSVTALSSSATASSSTSGGSTGGGSAGGGGGGGGGGGV